MKNNIPETLEEAILILVANNTNQLEKLRNDDMAKYHHGTGTNIRNTWGLWDKNSTLYKHLNERFGLSHADDLSGIIFHCFQQVINGKSWTNSIKEEIERYRKHWERFGYEIDGETKKKKNEKLQFTNSYLKNKDFGEKE